MIYYSLFFSLYMSNRESFSSSNDTPQVKQTAESINEQQINTKIQKLEKKVDATQPLPGSRPVNLPNKENVPAQHGEHQLPKKRLPGSPTHSWSPTQKPIHQSQSIPSRWPTHVDTPTTSWPPPSQSPHEPVILQKPHHPTTPPLTWQEPILLWDHDEQSTKHLEDNKTSPVVEVEEKWWSYRMFTRSMFAWSSQVRTQDTPPTSPEYTSRTLTPQQQNIKRKNKEILQASSAHIVPSLKQSLQPDELITIKEAILTNVQNEDWYQEKIKQIRSTWEQKWLSEIAIQRNINVYNEEVTTQLLPAFLAEMQQGNVVVKKGGVAIELSTTTKQALEQNNDYLLFKKLYEKFVLDPYEDLTDTNYLERDGLTNTSPLQQQMIVAAAYNPSLETFLFDNAHEKSEGYHETTKEQLVQNKSPVQYNHLALLLGYPELQDDEKPNPETYELYINELLNNLNPYTYKRCKQHMMIQYCNTLSSCFGWVQPSGKQTVHMMNIDFSHLQINEQSLQFYQPLTYQKYSSTLTIDGEKNTIWLPNGMDLLFGRVLTSHTIPTTTSYRQLERALQQQSQLTHDDVLSCKTIADLHQRITQKMQHAVEQFTPHPEQERITTLLEQEAFLTHRWTFFSWTNVLNKTPPLVFQNQQNSSALQATLTRRVYGGESKEPLEAEQLRRCSTILTDLHITQLFSPCYQNNSFGIENFLETIWFFERGNKISNDHVVLFFESLEQMAESQVQADQETGYRTLTSLIKQYTSITPQPLWIDWTWSAYTYTADHLIVPSQQTSMNA